MADALVIYLCQSLPLEIADLAESYIFNLEKGEYAKLLQDKLCQLLLGHRENSKTKGVNLEDFSSWNDFIFHRLGVLLADRSKVEGQVVFFCIGYAAFLGFLQSNVTGPPLPFNSAETLFPQDVASKSQRVKDIRSTLLEGLGMDGIAAYKLTPNVELLCLADAIFTCPPILKYVKAARWARLRVSFMQQRLLSEVSSSLQEVIYEDLMLLQPELLSLDEASRVQSRIEVEFLLERATIHVHHGLDKLAKVDLEEAKSLRDFEFALTGLLGKRTKFQQTDVSQLVVLAKSSTPEQSSEFSDDNVGYNNQAYAEKSEAADSDSFKPATVDLNDDTLLDSISFLKGQEDDCTDVTEHEALPAGLASLDPSNQPQLHPVDSTILLTFASSITNTSPSDGLTREETLPYATRVLEGGSSNWQVYTQALLVRSRIEGYKSRTVERGLLQLQALVDQVIAETTTGSAPSSKDGSADEQAATFLPRAKESESAPVTDRLRYIFQLASPTRWDLEAELAARWIQLGGMRSALEIYQRLEMWAEAALCWAATDREDKAQKIIRKQLYHATAGGDESESGDEETWSGQPRDPPPQDAPRLYCILGDIDQLPEMYEKSWEVSNQRYARAQRSLGRYWLAAKDLPKAAEAYSKSLKANQLSHASWFALGCVQLELADFEKAVETFSRCVQLDERDAEAWSNLGVALLRKEPNGPDKSNSNGAIEGDHRADAGGSSPEDDRGSLRKNRHEALKALRRAAILKQDSYRIWQNVLAVAASLSPPDYNAIVAAQKRVIELRGQTEGEKCIDTDILEMLIQHVVSQSDKYDQNQPGLQRMAVKFVDESVVPLITGSSLLWRLVSRLALWRNKPSSALDAEEKAWRAITSQPGWETEIENRWNEVVEATVRLCDSYESLGPQDRTEGMDADEPVARDWKFKARSAVRGVLGRGKATWDGTEGWDRLKEVMEGLKT